ncbi:hypothetical protein Bhyg_07850 [Pseudolycoriella hygida]|uniref:Uncharacterized protein n=1 Tax=Pseudolycoriella hygida TaxID=35572 RepID=A0A9Q0N599_9DIPT|nr:hypothetical protein Bhyg_07850 [Pseudolycoriella hygida]
MKMGTKIFELITGASFCTVKKRVSTYDNCVGDFAPCSMFTLTFLQRSRNVKAVTRKVKFGDRNFPPSSLDEIANH